MYGWMAFTGFAGVVILRIVGFLDNLWTGLGWLTVAALFVAVNQIPDAGTKRWVLIGLGVAVLFYVVVPGVWNMLREEYPITAGSAGLRKVETDLQIAERLQPHAQLARMHVRSQCERIAAAQGSEVGRIARKLADDYASNPLAGEVITRLRSEVGEAVAANQAFQEACERIVLGNARDQSIALPGTEVRVRQSHLVLALYIFGALAVIVVGARLLMRFFGSAPAAAPAAGAGARASGDGESRANFTLMVVFVAGMILWYVYWPGMTAEGSIIFGLVAVGGGALLLALIRGESYWGWAFTSIVLAVGGIFIAAMYRPGIF